MEETVEETLDWIHLMKCSLVMRDVTSLVTNVSVGEDLVFDSCAGGVKLDGGLDMIM